MIEDAFKKEIDHNIQIHHKIEHEQNKS